MNIYFIYCKSPVPNLSYPCYSLWPLNVYVGISWPGWGETPEEPQTPQGVLPKAGWKSSRLRRLGPNGRLYSSVRSSTTQDLDGCFREVSRMLLCRRTNGWPKLTKYFCSCQHVPCEYRCTQDYTGTGLVLTVYVILSYLFTKRPFGNGAIRRIQGIDARKGSLPKESAILRIWDVDAIWCCLSSRLLTTQELTFYWQYQTVANACQRISVLQ